MNEKDYIQAIAFLKSLVNNNFLTFFYIKSVLIGEDLNSSRINNRCQGDEEKKFRHFDKNTVSPN